MFKVNERKHFFRSHRRSSFDLFVKIEKLKLVIFELDANELYINL